MKFKKNWLFLILLAFLFSRINPVLNSINKYYKHIFLKNNI